MFGIPNPLDVASDWLSDSSADIVGKMVEKAKERPELIVIPVVVVAAALVVVAGSPAYSMAYAATAGAIDAAEEREFGHVVTGGILQ